MPRHQWPPCNDEPRTKHIGNKVQDRYMEGQSLNRLLAVAGGLHWQNTDGMVRAAALPLMMRRSH